MKLIPLACMLGVIFVSTGCGEVSAPTSAGTPTSAVDGIVIPDGAATVHREGPPGDDPRAWVFEDLGQPRMRVTHLTKGQCVFQYRRWNGRYTPVPVILRYDRQTEGQGSGVPIVLDLHRDGVLDVRATCVMPAAEASQTAALRYLERRIHERAFDRDENGGLQLYDLPTSEDGLAVRRATTWRAASLAFNRVADLLSAGSPVPKQLHARQQNPPPPLPEGCEYWEWNEEYEWYQCGLWELDPIEATACQESYLVWDPATEQCVCPNPGEDPEAYCTPDPVDPDPEEDPECDISDPTYPDCDGGSGGGGSGGSSGIELDLSCAPGTLKRAAQPVDCSASATGGPLLIVDWRFVAASGTGLPDVPHPQSTNPWSGTVVISGTVTVRAQDGMDTTSTSAAVTVNPRDTGIWTDSYWASRISFVPGQGNPNCKPHRVTPGDTVGWTGSLRKKDLCAGQEIELGTAGTSGYVLEEVTAGPNQSYWYVTSVDYFMESTSVVNPGLEAAGPAFSLTDPAQAQEVRDSLGLPAGAPVTINLHQFNASVKGINMAALIQDVYDHEEQHYLQARAELLKPGGNIYIEMEKIVEQSQYMAVARANDIYIDINNRMRLAAETQPTGNVSMQVWVWDEVQDRFVQVTISG